MKNYKLTLYALSLFFLGCCALSASAQEDKVIKFYRNGEVIEQYKASEIDYIEVADKVADDNGFINGHEYVDLGLPSGKKWATCNIGAEESTGYGDYFAWGEIAVKEEYTTANSLTLNKTLELSESGANYSGNPEYDAATANWGDPWRTPTDQDIQELLVSCTWRSSTIDGVAGTMVIGPNENFIFLPYTGYRSGKANDFRGSKGYYWSSSWYPTISDADEYSRGLLFQLGSHILDNYSRLFGFSIRPVSD